MQLTIMHCFEANMNDDDLIMITNTVLEIYKNKDDLKTGIKED